MYDLLNIPAHKNCQNCGKCCGVIPVTRSELAEIRRYVATRPDVRKLAIGQSGRLFGCPFRDETARRCAIYPVRPLICWLCGVTKGMECAHGNSAEIDGYRFIKGSHFDDMVLLSSQDWKGGTKL